MKRFLSKFLYVVGDKKPYLILILVLFVFISILDTIGIGMIGPFLALANSPDAIHKNSWLSSIYTTLGLPSESYFVALFGVSITIVFYAKSFFSFHVQRYVFLFSYTQKGDLAKKLLKIYLAAPYTFYLSRNTAQLIQNIANETNRFCNGIMLPLLNATAYGIVTLFLTALLISTDARGALAILFTLLIPMLIYNHYKHRLAGWGKDISNAQVGLIRTINHSLGSFKETRIIGCESYFHSELDKHIHQFEQAMSSAQIFKLLPRILLEAMLITFLVGFTSVILISSGNTQELTPVLGIFAIASIRLIPAISQLTTAVGGLKGSTHTLDKLYYDLKEVGAMDNAGYVEASHRPRSETGSQINTLDKPVLQFEHQIDLDQIVYSYPNISEPAIKGISLTIKKGQSVAFIGKSGAGKTTLVDVILGLLQIQDGDIKVDGISVYKNLRSWQDLVGYIPQSIFLMDDTIERNIAFGVPDHLIDPQMLQKAIGSAQLTELIAELPDGIQTRVGERGMRLSGGQRQRIGIARTLYHEREILVLDEATSALDNETEELVSSAIQSLSGQKTLIIIAHRLTTVRHCDRIYLMKKGRIVKSGTYETVVLSQSTI
jgi:ATP-binding cassette, subfamily B, bacterial PglK